MSLRVGATFALTLAVGCMLVSCGGGRVPEGSGNRTVLGGVISSDGIGSIRFGSSPTEVRRAAGKPDFTSPSGRTFPTPALGTSVLIWGYECAGIRGYVCQTLFGFRHRLLTTFVTNSRRFALETGVRPGMTVKGAKERYPEGTFTAGCSTLLLPTTNGVSIAVYIAKGMSRPFVFSLYASTDDRAFAPSC